MGKVLVFVEVAVDESVVLLIELTPILHPGKVFYQAVPTPTPPMVTFPVLNRSLAEIASSFFGGVPLVAVNFKLGGTEELAFAAVIGHRWGVHINSTARGSHSIRPLGPIAFG